MEFTSTNPAKPGDVVGAFKEHTAADVDRAINRASDAQRRWARTPVPARAELIANAAATLEQRKPQLAQLVTREVGKIGVEASGEVQEAIDMARFVGGMGRMVLGTVHPSELPDKIAWTTRQPVGVVGAITPWNFPLAIPSWKVFPALLAGNAIVFKASEHAPACADAFVDALIAADIPRDLVHVVHGHAEPGQALATHPRVGALSFTGSVPTGRAVASAAMDAGPKIVSLELGGKNAMVVLADADLHLACDGAIFGAFGTSGQRCTSTSRLIVHSEAAKLVERIAERAERLHVADPADQATDVGPVITNESLERIDAYVRDAVREGADLVCGGRRVQPAGCEDGSFYEPTVLRVKPEHRIAREEVFGPVLAVIEVDSADEAIDVVNASEYGLSAAIYTRDINTALSAVVRIDTGIVYVNAPTIGAEMGLPFGGTKKTGNGFRDAGERAIEQFSQLKTVYIDHSGRLQRAQIDTEGRS
jgi:aldehyde dehydrogenase (NAD+)